MIQGPCSGAISEADSASQADLTALATTVSGNTSTISTMAATADLTAAESDITTHTGQIASLTTSFNNIGNDF